MLDIPNQLRWVVQKQLNPGLNENSKEIFQKHACNRENIFAINLAHFLFSSFKGRHALTYTRSALRYSNLYLTWG